MNQNIHDKLIGLLLDSGPLSVVGMLGVLKAGCGFVPLDPEYPAARLAFILSDCGIKTLVTQAKHLRLAYSLASRNTELQHIVCVDGIPDTEKNNLSSIKVYERQDWVQKSIAAPRLQTVPANLAYVVYTSGSTGTPKGVPITHQSLVPMLRWGQDYFQLGKSTKVLQNLSFCFDFGIFEVLTTLLSGGTLYFLDKDRLVDIADYARYMNAQGINTLHTTPAFFKLLAKGGVGFDTLLVLHLGGEELSQAALEEMLAVVNERCVIYNGYGPTEATINSSIFKVSCRRHHEHQGLVSIPIGRASANNRLYVLDFYGQPVPIGVLGELHVGGIGLARGYLHQPELTASKFTPDPFSTKPGGRLYKTGDLVRFLPDGNLEFIGRVDHQVKIRGFRIELGEIELLLNQHPAVQEAIVLARPDATGEKQLVAYLVPQPGESITADSLLPKLREQLPTYMIPAKFVFLAALPLTPSGKVDRRNLPAPDNSEVVSAAEFSPPETALEEKVAELWSQVLGTSPIGVYDNFFEIGGHSLKATQVIYRINQAFPIQLPLRSIFQEPTIAGLALLIEEALIEKMEEKVRADAAETDKASSI